MFYYFLALFMGLAIAMQSPINASLGRALQASPLIASLCSFFIGTLCLLLIAIINGELNITLFQNLPKQEWWKFLGGVLGAFFVFGTILIAPKIGLVSMFIIMLVGQLLTSLILDSIGAFDLNTKAITWQKITGLVIILAGLGLYFSKEIKI